MTCRAYENRLEELEDYLQDRLTGAAAASLTAHLGECKDCRAAIEEARLAGSFLRAAIEPASEPSGQFWFRVRAGIRQQEQMSQFWRPLEVLAQRLAFGASVALLLLTGFVLTERFSPPLLDASQSTEIREIFPEPMQQPISQDEVLLSLAGTGNGR